MPPRLRHRAKQATQKGRSKMSKRTKGTIGSQLQDEAVTVFSKTVELTDTQIKALPTTPAEIVQGEAGKVLIFIAATLLVDVSGGAYGNITDRHFEFTWGGGNEGIAITPRFGATVPLGGNIDAVTLSTAGPVSASVQALTDAEARSIVLRIPTGAGDFIDGNPANILRVTVLYLAIEV